MKIESLKIGFLLAFTGGIINAYTYLFRGKVLATVVTGNIVLLAIQLTELNMAGVFHYLVPILSFALGVFVAEFVKYRTINFHKYPHFHRHIILLEITILLIVLLLPDFLANILIAFVSAIQIESFRFIRGFPAFTTMCTGNLRSAMDALSSWYFTKDNKHLASLTVYISIILAFFLGVCSCKVASLFLDNHVLVITIIPLFLVLLLIHSTKKQS